MKKLIATICLAIGMFSASFAENPSVNAAPSNPNVALAPEKKSDTPDAIIVVVDDRGVKNVDVTLWKLPSSKIFR